MNKEIVKQNKKIRRQKKVRAKITGTAKRPRLNVFRSNKGMYLQLIDDDKGVTLASARSIEVKKKDGKTSISFELGKIIAKKGLDPAKNKTGKKIKNVLFDRGSNKYHGRIKAVADGAREGGLKF